MIKTLPPKLHSVSFSLHPAFALKGLPQFMPSIFTGLARARRWARAGKGPEASRKINAEPTPQEVIDHIAKGGKGPIAVDIETPRDEPTKIELVGLCAVEGEAVVFPFAEPFISILKELLEDKTIVKVFHNGPYDILGFLANNIEPAGPIADTQHAGALIWTPIQKKKKTGTKDTTSMKWLDLASCTLRVLDGVGNWKEPTRSDTFAIYKTRFPHAHHFLYRRYYCGYDVIYTRALWIVERVLLQREGMWELYSQIVAPAAQTLIRMEHRGLRVDETKRVWLRGQVEILLKKVKEDVHDSVREFHSLRRRRVEEALAPISASLEALEAAGSPIRCSEHPDFLGLRERKKCGGCSAVYKAGADARASIAKEKARVKEGQKVLDTIGEEFSFKDEAWRSLFFSPPPIGLGLTPVAKTKKTKVAQVTNKALEELFTLNPNVPLLRKRVEYTHLVRRLKVGLAAPLDSLGRAHFSYNLSRSAFGRLSSGSDDTEPDKVRKSSGGNAQNIRDEDKIVYIPSKPDRVIVHFDWSQIEARNVAWHAREFSLLDAWKRGEDVHAINAAACFNILPSEAKTFLVLHKGKWVPARYAGKTRVHAWNYGMQDEETARQGGITIEEARRQRTAYFSNKPAILQYHVDTIARAISQRGLHNSFGRRIKFYGYRKRADGTIVMTERNEALAFIGQSETSEQCKAVLPDLENTATSCDGDILLTAHDSFDFEISLIHLREFIPRARQILEKEWPQLGYIEGYGYFRCPVEVKVGKNMGERHVCAEQPRPCDEPCLLENPDGLTDWKEEA